MNRDWSESLRKGSGAYPGVPATAGVWEEGLRVTLRQWSRWPVWQWLSEGRACGSSFLDG